MAKFIIFDRVGDINNRPAYDVKNKKGGYLLGFIEYCKEWKQYIFCPEEEMQFSQDCLVDIIKFIEEI